MNNNLVTLDRNIFLPVVESLLGRAGAASGQLLIDGNPLECGCDIAWLVTNSSLLNVVSDGHCVNGTKLTHLDSNFFQQSC